jgi:hypothetical protein
MPSGFPFRPSDSQVRVQLEHGWEFLADPTAKVQVNQLEAATGWRPARVGLSWNVQFADLREYMGAAWYRTRFEAPLTRETRHVLLKFGAVDYFCQVFVNGTFAGSHEGGYTPFSLDVSRLTREGVNELAVRVVDPPMDEAMNQELFPEMLYNEIPHGKQNWYVQNSGIWQGVRIEFAPAIYIDRAQVTPKINGDFQLDVFLEGEGQAASEIVEGSRIRAVISDNSGRTVWQTISALTSPEMVTLTGTISQPRLWGPNQPALYTLDVSLEGTVAHHRRTRFGFRELAARDGGLFLNGKPFFMIAALDQDFYPETIHTPASEEFVRDMMLKAKRLGINVLRCHLKVAHPVYLDVADELGMLVWAELPSWSDCWFPCDHFSPKAAQRGEQMFAEVVVRDWNHPCLVIQTIMNESWGINLKDAPQRAWLKEAFDRIKSELAPLGRLVIDNSPCEGNFHLKTDIEDYHNYYSQPDQASLWDTFVAEFATRAGWTFSRFGDAERTGNEPLVVSEFGNWGLPKLPSQLPWWFQHAFGEREVTRPAGVLERFRQYKLDRIFADYNDIAEQTQWHQFTSLKYEIESMRSYPSIKGYCVTGMTDVHWEANGLLDMWRNEKVFADDLSRIQQPDMIIARLASPNLTAGQEVQVPIVFSHYGDRDLTGARVRWMTDSGLNGSFAIERAIAPGTSEALTTLKFTAQSCSAPTRDTLQLEVRARNGNRLCENKYDFFVYPATTPAHETPLFFYDPAGTNACLERNLREAGHRVKPFSEIHASDSLLISSVVDERVLALLSNGGRALVLANSEDVFGPEMRYRCTKRAATWLDGRWFSNYNWIDPNTAPYRELGFNRLLGFESRETAPDYVIENLLPKEFDDVLSGITVGWLNLNCGLTMQAQVGAGKAVVTTYKFDQYGRDPYATHLLGAYMRYATSDFQPKIQWQSAAMALSE